jgi:hypothetical protein
MARNTIFFEHPQTGVIKKANVGFCWHLVLLGPQLPMYHGLWKLGIATLTVQTLTFGVSNLVLAVWYNKLYIRALLAKGFQVFDAEIGTLEEVEALIDLKLPRHHFH